MNLIKIGNYIMTKRKELTLTQEQLAEKVGVSSKTISKWECGKSLPACFSMAQLFNGSNAKDFISGVLTGLSIGEMLVGIYVAMKSVAKQ